MLLKTSSYLLTTSSSKLTKLTAVASVGTDLMNGEGRPTQSLSTTDARLCQHQAPHRGGSRLILLHPMLVRLCVDFS
jgi:hypothetical protein